MTVSRRNALTGAGLLGAGAMLAGAAAGSTSAQATSAPHPGAYPPGRPGVDYTPVVTLDGAALPFKVRDGVKIFHLVAEAVDHPFMPGLNAKLWGYNGRCHGPTIEAVEGDRVRIYVTNRLEAATTVHWHGLILAAGMDGVGGLSQKTIQPGETYVYEFPLVQHGTHFYHSHHDEMTQIALGLSGLFIIHPRRPARRVDRDFAYLLSEWRIRPGASRPDPNEMLDWNLFTLNAKAFPATAPMVARQGERVRIRIVNTSPMDHHPMHLHGHTFKVTGTDGGPTPEAAQQAQTTVLVPVGSARDIEFVADNPGDWAFHCHMTHHVMNQMGHNLPVMIGVDPAGFEARAQDVAPAFMAMGQAGMGDHGQHIGHGLAVPANSRPMAGAMGPDDYITMGGMVSILKVRPGITSYDDPGWYTHPPRTQAWRATPEALAADGVEV